MIQSRSIEIDGQLVGAAVHSARDWHFVATDPRLDDLHGQRFPSPAEAARVAQLVLLRESGAPAVARKHG